MLKRAAVFLYKKALGALRGTGIGRFQTLRKLDAFVMRRLKQREVVINGNRMVLDATDSLRLSIDPNFEPCETRLMSTELKPGDVVVDVGANIGYYTLLAASKVGAQGKVYAFEPDPTNFALLKKNVELNGHRNVVLVNKAVTDKSGELKLYLSDVNMGDHRAYASEENRPSITIPCTTMDDFFRGHKGRVDFIKIDIQGFECHALRGMQETLRRSPGVRLTAEFWPYGLTRAGDSPEELLRLLRQNRFKLYDIDEKTGKLEAIDDAQLLGTYSSDTKDFTNLFGVMQ